MCKICGCFRRKVEKQVFTVEGMSCGHCKAAVEKAVLGLSGVLAAEVDLAAKTLQVEYDVKKSSVEEIIKTVAAAGYSAKAVA
jgi:copper chaperone